MEVTKIDTIDHRTRKYRNEYGGFNIEDYSDMKESAVLTALRVLPQYQGKGHGKDLLNQAEGIARLLGFEEIILKVEEGTWQEEWYKRSGYEFLLKENEDSEYVWLKKDLI